MTTRIQKWGNSLALRLPRAFAEQAHIQDGAEVELALRKGQIIIQAVQPATFRLEELLASVSKDNVHHEVDTGAAVGRESW